jgi:hypothetical protein
MKFLLLGSLALLALAFVSTSVSGELVTVNVSANNTVVSVKLDDIVHVELSGNPSTGSLRYSDPTKQTDVALRVVFIFCAQKTAGSRKNRYLIS